MYYGFKQILLCNVLCAVLAKEMYAASNQSDAVQCAPDFKLVSNICLRLEYSSQLENCGILNQKDIFNYVEESVDFEQHLRSLNITELWLDNRHAPHNLNKELLAHLQREWLANRTALTHNTIINNVPCCYKYSIQSRQFSLSDCHNNLPRLCAYDPVKGQLLSLACPAGTTSVIYKSYQNLCFSNVAATDDADGTVDPQLNKNKDQIFKPNNPVEYGIHGELLTNPEHSDHVRVFELNEIKMPELSLHFKETIYKLFLKVTSPEFILRRNGVRNEPQDSGILCFMEPSVTRLELNKVDATDGSATFEVQFTSPYPHFYYCEAVQIFTHTKVRSVGPAVVAYKELRSPLFTVQLRMKLNFLLFSDSINYNFTEANRFIVDRLRSIYEAEMMETVEIDIIQIDNYDLQTNVSTITVHMQVSAGQGMANEEETVIAAYRRLNKMLGNSEGNSKENREHFAVEILRINSTFGCISGEQKLVKLQEVIATNRTNCINGIQRAFSAVCTGDKVYGGVLLQTRERIISICPFVLKQANLSTLIGESLSILGVIIILLTAILLKDWRSRVFHQLIIHYSITYLLFVLLKIFESNLDLNLWICSIFLFMSLSVWSLTFAIRHYILYVKVFVNLLLENYFKGALCIAYGVPLLPIIPIISIKLWSQDPGSINEQILIYGIFVPIAVILLSIFVIISMIIFNFMRTSWLRTSRLRTNSSQGFSSKFNQNKVFLLVMSFTLVNSLWLCYILLDYVLPKYCNSNSYRVFEGLVFLHGLVIFVCSVLLIPGERKYLANVCLGQNN